ncbi:hypothetical protein F5Y15DRAFT_368977 [Xylariaceae sp. FL0016]|nr:hypothetical protein F5Y15DRAFT_368977 [Xylariaceae sp. FL0016]
MSCACRGASLRLFVQSLTGVHFANANGSVTRSSGRIHPGLLTGVGARRLLSRPLPRSFSSASAVLSPRQRVQASSDHSQGCQAGESPLPTDTHSQAYPIPSPTVHASASDLDSAKHGGAVFEYSPESVDILSDAVEDANAEVEHLHLSSREHHGDPNVHIEPPPFSSSPSMRTTKTTKSPVGKSRLKRLKIIKEEPKPAEDAPPTKEPWQIQKKALKEKFPEGWTPRKRLSPDALEGIRALHQQFPEQYTTPVLAAQFEVSPEAIRRILRSKWAATPEEEEDRQDRWFRRGKGIWGQMAALGKKPPRKWRREGVVRDPIWNLKRGPRTQWPYVPRHLEKKLAEEEESAQRKLGGKML